MSTILNVVAANIAMNAVQQHRLMASTYLGAIEGANIKDTNIVLVFDTALMNASAAARFAGGRGIVFDIQPNATTRPVYIPGTISIMLR